MACLCCGQGGRVWGPSGSGDHTEAQCNTQPEPGGCTLAPGWGGHYTLGVHGADTGGNALAQGGGELHLMECTQEREDDAHIGECLAGLGRMVLEVDNCDNLQSCMHHMPGNQADFSHRMASWTLELVIPCTGLG